MLLWWIIPIVLAVVYFFVVCGSLIDHYFKDRIDYERVEHLHIHTPLHV
jgi:hypothetical protein